MKKIFLPREQKKTPNPDRPVKVRSSITIQGFIARNNFFKSERQFVCLDGSVPTYRNGSFDNVVGIIGGQSSSVSIQLANLLRLFKVPQVS